jgi:hypothetical protein
MVFIENSTSIISHYALYPLVHIGQRADSLIRSSILTEIVFFSPSLKRLSIKMSNYSDRMVMILPQSLHLQ